MILTKKTYDPEIFIRLVFIAFSLFCFCITGKGQDNIDSLKNLINQSRNDSVRAHIYNSISYDFYRINQDSSSYYANKALHIASENHIPYEKANAYYNIGRTYYFTHHYSLALQYLETALNIYKNIGSLFGEALMLNSIGIVYRNINITDKSRTYTTEAYHLFKKINNKKYIAITLSNLGRDYLSEKKYDKAEDLMRRSINVEGETDNNVLLMQYYISMGTIYKDGKKDYGQALGFYRKSMEYAEKANSPLDLSRAISKIGEVYIQTGDYDSALFYLDKAMSFYDQVKSKTILHRGYEFYIDYYVHLNDYKKAFEYSRLLMSLHDSIFTEETNTKLAEFEVMYETLKNEETIKHLNDQKQIQQLRLTILLVIIALVILIIVFLIKYYREKINISNQEKKELQNILELRDKELASTALNFAQNNELLARTTKKLIKQQQKSNTGEQEEIQNIIHELRSQVSNDSFHEFELRFLKVHNNFYDKLRADFPKLSPNDLKMCALLRLNLSSKDIANILHMSSASVNVTRSRIRKKMNLSKSINLVSFLMDY
ncbi:MAG TPA: tetratricopeptide repeat protein [Bacteroidetes bacterium]|nr:tetratricopeptide repeat protein [Bacteroidota bacterium]